jgi:hypothetical protein
MPAKTAVARETTTSLRIQTPPGDAPVVQRGGDVSVWMPKEHAGGARAFGPLVPGTVYRVSAREAHRLVTAKRFRFAGAADQAAVSDYVDGIADAADKHTKE